MKLLFLQQRPVRAGQQTSLARLLQSLRDLGAQSLVLCARPGWLVEWCASHAIDCAVLDSPNSRSLRGRLYANRRYVTSVAARLEETRFSPDWVVANDTQEGLHAAQLAEQLRRPWAAFLRKPSLRRDEFLKYRAHEARAIFAVGAELQRDARNWLPQKIPEAYSEGLLDTEFFPPGSKPAAFPRRILIAGSEQPRKGWQDLVTALGRVESDTPDFPPLELTLTGTQPETLLANYRGRCRFEFIGRVNEFAERVRQFDLAVHPSRDESFGLAPFEILAAGVPVLCSQTGAMDETILPPELLFPPGDAAALAERLRHLHRSWPRLDFRMAERQARLRAQYSARAFAEKFLAILNKP